MPRHLVADGLDVRDAPVGERLHRATKIVAIVGGHALVAAEDRREHVGDVGRLERRQVHHLETGRRVAQQPMRPGDVSRRQHEAVRALGQGVDELANDVAQARKALERAEFERFVEQERARFAAGRASGVEKGEQRVEGFARAARGPCPRRATGMAMSM